MELQAPQGPYTNVLDFQVLFNPYLEHETTRYLHPFPYLHVKQTQRFSLQCQNITDMYYKCLTTRWRATTARIWQVAQNVWKGITSAMVCRAFVLAYRIMNKIIEEDGNNAWICHGTPHCTLLRTT